MEYYRDTRFFERGEEHGRTKDAVREAIRICKDRDVLKDCLEKKKSEVVDIMMQLYDQEEIMRVHDIGVARDSGIMNVVAVLKGMGLSFVEVANKIAEQFSLTKERAESEISEYWSE